MLCYILLTDKCPGDCIADRIADYCEAYFKSTKLCGIGKKCCITKDADYPPGDIIIPTAYKNGTTVSTEKLREETVEDNKTTTNNKKKPQKTNIATKTDSSLDEEKPCKGECVAGLFALFCDDIDSDAFCPGEASCCVKNDESDNNYIEEKQTTTLPPRTKPSTKATKVYFL